MDDNSVDSIVCDPPYELGFMGKRWDASGIAYDTTLWAECLRVLKPGGHLIAFGGTRTYHRMTVAIEDAGFEIRDSVIWMYGSGFPKSLDVSKAIDKQAGIWRGRAGVIQSENSAMSGANYERTDKGDPATPDAQQWHGYGTALKPAHEPAVLARKPLTGTVADNVLTWGTGALNIDGCRVEAHDGYEKAWDKPVKTNLGNGSQAFDTGTSAERGTHEVDISANKPVGGRWPANVILDEHAAEALDEQSGHSVSKSGGKSGSNANPMSWHESNSNRPRVGHTDSGGASRFFYNIAHENVCTLCYNTYVKDMTKESICESICASNVENRGWTTQETSEFTAHVRALMMQGELLAQTVKSVASLCDLCATSIAVALVATKTSGFNRNLCERILDYMPSSASSTLIQNLASYADAQDSTDTTQTIQSLLRLFGSVLRATENCIKPGKRGKAVGDNAPDTETRFLYVAKASRAEREAGLDGLEVRKVESDFRQGGMANPRDTGNYAHRANHHPTVKPITLMRHLVRLVTPKGGTVLDPFMGSGSTGCAAMLEGMRFVGIDITAEYVDIAERRIQHWLNQNPMEL
jgi:site-specific DNA-methyltransferase (adenine-specific)